MSRSYLAFRDRATARLPRLGPSFFTKVIYFAGYRRGRGGVQPLVLDAVVARQLRRLGVLTGRGSGSWTSQQWLSYLDWAAEEATDPKFGGEPEQVELELFRRGAG